VLTVVPRVHGVQARHRVLGRTGPRDAPRHAATVTAMLVQIHPEVSAALADGRPVVRLHVEQDNTTGAVGVYESAGMRREYALQVWTRPA